jgi:hypothetical protein
MIILFNICYRIKIRLIPSVIDSFVHFCLIFDHHHTTSTLFIRDSQRYVGAFTNFIPNKL